MINIILKNTDGYVLSLTKNKCENPEDLYELVLTEEVTKPDGTKSISQKEFFLTTEELGYFARALIV